jgi:hypothetical protein
MFGASAILKEEAAIIEAARDLAPALGQDEATMERSFAPHLDLIREIGNEGACLLVHWLDVFNPAQARPPHRPAAK